ncbi:lipopolysaccharide biosynthesis protein [Sphingobium sp. TomMM35A]
MSIRKSLLWNYGTHLLIFAVTFGSAIIMSRLLTPRELGVFGVGAAISAILSTFSLFGVANYLIRDNELSNGTIATGFTVNAILNIAVSVLLWLLGTMGRQLFTDPAIPLVLQWFALVPLAGIFEFLPATLLTRNMRFGTTSLLQLGKSTVNAATMIGFAHAGWSYLSPVFGTVTGAAFGALGFSILGGRHVSLRLSLRGGGTIVVFAVQMVFAGGVSILAARLAELIIAQMLGLAVLGLYTRASGLAAMVWEGAYGLSTRVIYVQMAAELREQGSLKEIFLRATKLLTAVMWPIMAGIAVLAGPIVHLLYGARWDGAALPLAFLMAGQFIAIGFAMNWELCVLTGRTGWQARTEAARALIGLSLFSIGAVFSLPIATASRIVEAFLGYLMYRPKMAQMAQATLTELREAYEGSPILVVVAVGPAFLLMVLSDWSVVTSITQVAIAIIAGVGCWLLTLYATDHPLFDEVRQLVRDPSPKTEQESPVP